MSLYKKGVLHDPHVQPKNYKGVSVWNFFQPFHLHIYTYAVKHIFFVWKFSSHHLQKRCKIIVASKFFPLFGQQVKLLFRWPLPIPCPSPARDLSITEGLGGALSKILEGFLTQTQTEAYSVLKDLEWKNDLEKIIGL